MLIPFGLRGALLGFSQRRINLPSIAKNIRVIRVICVPQKTTFSGICKVISNNFACNKRSTYTSGQA